MTNSKTYSPDLIGTAPLSTRDANEDPPFSARGVSACLRLARLSTVSKEPQERKGSADHHHQSSRLIDHLLCPTKRRVVAMPCVLHHVFNASINSSNNDTSLIFS